MSSGEEEDKTIYKVVVNHEEQYSIWPADRENALGCLNDHEVAWVKLRPLRRCVSGRR
jgi:uncharacterized protein YbdZ (MbtH family)